MGLAYEMDSEDPGGWPGPDSWLVFSVLVSASLRIYRWVRR
jgi:hypothetical protein